MNKKTSEKILNEIKKANSILLPFHISPDGDCVGAVLAMDLFLRKLGKKTKIISYSKIPKNLAFFPGMEEVEIANFAKINLTEFDLIIFLDCADKIMITRNEFPLIPAKTKTINIDHHITNPKFADLNLVRNASSTTEVIFCLFKRWKNEIDRQTAKLLFLGIFTDTGCFQYSSTSPAVLSIVRQLMKKGADLDETVLTQFRSYSFKTLKYWSRVLANMKLDESGKFAWSKVSAEEIREIGLQPEEIDGAASLFAPVTKGTEFGIILDENEGFIKGSIRSRARFDVSKIAVELGGGGHKQAAGFSLKMPLEEAEKKVLETARRYIKLIRNFKFEI